MSNTNSADVTLYHNPNCSKSRGALELLNDIAAKQSLSLAVVEYLRSPLSAEDLHMLVTSLPVAPAELVRNDKNFKALGLDPDAYVSADQVVSLLLEHPELMQRPIALYKSKALIGRPPENLQALFS